MTKIEQHAAVCAEIASLYERKNHDYGDSFSRNYSEFGMVYPIMHIQEKLDRIKTLSKQSECMVNESLEDSLLDMANYAIMTVVENSNRRARPANGRD